MDTSPDAIKSFLNDEHTKVSVNEDLLMHNPIFVLTCFRYLQMFGGKSQIWLVDQMRKWLIWLSSGSNFNFALK